MLFFASPVGRSLGFFDKRIAAAILPLLLLAAWLSTPVRASSGDCAGCHRQQVEAWRDSHHALAMQPATPATVLADFDNARATYRDTAFRFYRKGASFRMTVTQGGADGEDYAITHTFGVFPLQQYLAELPGGVRQALPVAWDSRPAGEGGQRWYALESDLPWRHFGFTWNTSCAECHSTGIEKNHDPEQHTFDTRWRELNVACGACHGDPGAHYAWLEKGQPDTHPHAGFEVTLAERGHWRLPEGEAIARRARQPNGRQLSTCAQCHAHGQRIGDWHPRSDLLDHIGLSLITPALYYPDGQIREEVYVTGSFLQSAMHGAGVVCSNCHEPHSLALRAEGNALCEQCHRPAVFDTPDHHHHTPDSSGAQCVNCHMPATTYMGVDDRRDHRFGIPQPSLSAEHGIPNACNRCHSDRDATWSQQALRQWEATDGNPDPHARVFAAADAGEPNALPRLKLLADTGSLPPILEASALHRLSALPDDGTLAIATAKLKGADPLIRLGAVRALQNFPPERRWQTLRPLLQDDAKAVRLEATRLLLDALSQQEFDGERQQLLQTAVKEYEQTLQRQADHPGALMSLGQLYNGTGKSGEAETQYRRALAIDPGFIPAYINLADLYRQRGQEARVRDTLGEALAADPSAAGVHYALGLSDVRRRDYEAALVRLRRAHELESDNPDYAFTLAVALEQTGDPDGALAVLDAFIERGPYDPRIIDLAARYAAKYRGREAAQRYMEQLPAR